MGLGKGNAYLVGQLFQKFGLKARPLAGRGTLMRDQQTPEIFLLENRHNEVSFYLKLLEKFQMTRLNVSLLYIGNGTNSPLAVLLYVPIMLKATIDDVFS